MDYLLGIDIGTSGTKTLLMSAEGEIIDITVSDYDIQAPQINWAEEDPAVWWEALKECLGKIREDCSSEVKNIAAIGLSGQMHGAVFVDEKGRPLYPCILWADNRTDRECQLIKDKIGSEKINKITGNPVIPAYTAPKILWFKEHRSDLYRQTHRILMAKDYIGYRLTGNFFTDYSDASGTLLFDINKKCWSEEIFTALDLDLNKHPEIVRSAAVTGTLTGRAAEELGLKPDIPVMAGAGDLACGAIGNANLAEGTASVTIGTAGQVVATVDKVYPGSTGKAFNFCHGIEDKYFTLASILSAGLCLKWYKDNISLLENMVTRHTSLDSFDILLEGIEDLPPGANGLLFLPYLNGAGTPHMDDKAKGVFAGLTAGHSRKDMVRAIIEGVSFGIRECLETLQQVGLNIDEILISAGGAKNEKWRQIQASIYNKPVTTLKVSDTSPFGAAILAAIGQGKFTGIEEACSFYVQRKEELIPAKKQAALYNEIYATYKELYPALRETFTRINNYREKIQEEYQ